MWKQPPGERAKGNVDCTLNFDLLDCLGGSVGDGHVDFDRLPVRVGLQTRWGVGMGVCVHERIKHTLILQMYICYEQQFPELTSSQSNEH